MCGTGRLLGPSTGATWANGTSHSTSGSADLCASWFNSACTLPTWSVHCITKSSVLTSNSYSFSDWGLMSSQYPEDISRRMTTVHSDDPSTSPYTEITGPPALWPDVPLSHIDLTLNQASWILLDLFFLSGKKVLFADHNQSLSHS